MQIATVLTIIVIIGLFMLVRDGKARTSKALWIPVIYLFIGCSRSVSAWLGLAPPDTSDGVYSSPMDAALNFALLALGGAAVIARRTKAQSLLRQSGPLWIFYSYAALSILWSDFPYLTLKHWTKAIEDMLMVLVVATDENPVMAIERLLTRIGFIVIPLSLLFCKYYPDLGRGFNKDWETMYMGAAGTKNELGIICLIFGLASLWCILGAHRDHRGATRRRRLLAHGAMLGIVVVLLQMSHSATPSVCFVLSGAVLVFTNRRSPGIRTAGIHLPVAAALCAVLIPIFIAPSLVQSLGRDTTFSGRTVIWHVLPTFVHNPWLGAGYETFLMGPRLVALKDIIDKTFQEAHNGYLEVWLNLGWIGVSLFAVLLIAGYRRAVTACRLDPAFGSLRLAFFVAVVIEGMTEAAFRMLSPTWFVLLWAMTGPVKAAPPRPWPSMGGGPVWAFDTAKTEYNGESAGLLEIVPG